VDAGGRQQRLLARGVDGDSAPVWSPDGHLLAFAGRRAGKTGVFLVLAVGGSPRRLTHGADTEVTWSPDSRRLAFRRGVLVGDLWVVDASGEGLHNLTRTPRLDERDPAWRPQVG
jgi:Tol biopolymer transport system component